VGMQSIWVHRPTLSAKNAEKGGAPAVLIFSERLGQPPAEGDSYAILARRMWSELLSLPRAIA
jgi:hypothetical protein